MGVGCLFGGRLTLEDTWLLAWKRVLDFKAFGLRRDHVGWVDPEVHMACEGVL